MADLENPSETVALAPDSEPVVLNLRDLLPDSGGEIVLHSAGLGLVLSTDQTIRATGTTGSHVTAAGEDVSGYRFYQLEGGITLYCQADTSLLLNPGLA